MLDPFISFDQQRFDDLAAQLGVPSVSLDRYFTLDFSPGLDLFPPVPSDLGQILGLDIDQLLGIAPSSNGVAEPSALTVLLTGLGLLAAALRRVRAPIVAAIAHIAAITAAHARE